jgi:ribonuclease E
MSKELFVSSTPHETKVAIVEDDLLSEIYYERENEYTLAGSIYKGRVTRVLPGMQSAFVDIGLERDAFLYVSDFLEHAEEEDEEFEQLPAPSHSIQASAPARENGSGVDEAEEEADSGSAEAAGQPSADETHSEREPRRWRGRRSRRRGRGGLPESKFVPQAGASGPSEAPKGAAYDPIVLPGESLAKYGQSEEQDSREREESSAESPVGSAPEQTSTTPAEAVSRKSPEISGWDGGLTLPGESISKYRPRDEVSPATSEAPAVEERRSSFEGRRSFERRRTERHTDPAPAGPPIFALPGESISKYKGSASEAQHAAISETEEQQRSVTTTDISEQPAEQRSKISAGVSETPAASFLAHDQHEVDEHPANGEAEDRETRFETHEVEPSTQQIEETEKPPVEAASAQSELSAPPEAEIYAEPAPATEQENATSPQVFAPGAGHIEEEIIEEEEIEPELLVESYEDSLYDELEEETIEADAGEEITEAVRDSHVEERTGPGYVEYEAPDTVEAAETDVEEAEPTEEDTEAEGEDEEYADRAEVRAPAATAGFQQRAERSAPAERRGGRRRFQKRRVHARRNIQRASMPTISELLKEGQEILVQIAKEPIAKKGARITSHIALPGRFLVYMPTVNHVGVSRKIGSDEERQRLKRILISEKGNAHGGFIVRTAAAGASEEELRADIRFLINLWTEIKSRSDSGKAPALIYHDLNLVERVLRDLVNTSFSSIWVDTEQEYERIVRFLNRFQPSLLKKVKLYTKETPLFEQFGIQDEINKALKSKVWLKSGGYIVINQTEALVAIDINTGKFVGKTARLEDTIVKTNLDAIKEIVRQIRLRDLGGIIVIDFIDMDERKNRQKVMQGLEDALRADRAPSKVLQFNDFGLVAITRKRVKQSLERTLGTPCTYCTGTGMIKSVQTICNEIYVEMRKMAKHLEHHDVMLRVHPEVVKGLKEKGGRWLQEMEELTGKTIIVKSDPTLHQEQFDIN